MCTVLVYLLTSWWAPTYYLPVRAINGNKKSAENSNVVIEQNKGKQHQFPDQGGG
jgi:hypothetical protein